MSDTAYIIGAFLVSGPGIIGAVAGGISAYYGRKNHGLINSKMTELVQSAKDQGMAEGQLKGTADEQARMKE